MDIFFMYMYLYILFSIQYVSFTRKPIYCEDEVDFWPGIFPYEAINARRNTISNFEVLHAYRWFGAICI